MRILIAQINPTVGDLAGNTRKILSSISKARESSVDLVLFSELCLCGYPPLDLLLLPDFIEEAGRQLELIIKASMNITVIVGFPRQSSKGSEKFLHNSAAVIHDGSLIGTHDKILLPTYDVFDERRYFEPGKETGVWNLCGKKVAVTICEDIWQHSHTIADTCYTHDPILKLQGQKPDLLVNLSASPFSKKKPEKRLNVCSKAAASLDCPLLICNQVGANDSIIFDGYSLYLNSNGELIKHAKGFEEDHLIIDLERQAPAIQFIRDPVKDLYRALCLGVRDYFHKLGFTKACLGLSGGVDSALVACIAAEALGKENVLALFLPSLYSSKESERDARQLAKKLEIEFKTIPIDNLFQHYLETLKPHFSGKAADATEENLQARIRATLLMALSNKWGYLLLTTGNKSEFAMGYCTLYGDMCGSLGVINDLTKTEVYALAQWINRNEEIIPAYVITRPPSAELKPDQKDSDTLPEYSILDPILTHYVEESASPSAIAAKTGTSEPFIHNLVQKIHSNEYKRRQAPPGLRVTEKAFSVGRCLPIVQKWV
jgi:NAD+ synthase (glutamine-hydrolysing)